jgi:peroxiredoxin
MGKYRGLHLILFKTALVLSVLAAKLIPRANVSSADRFQGKKVVFVALTRALTPTYSSIHLAGFEAEKSAVYRQRH